MERRSNSSEEKGVASIIVVGVVLLALVVGVILVQRRTNIKSNADVSSVALRLMPSENSVSPGQALDLSVFADTGENSITAAEIHLSYDPSQLEVKGIDAGTPLTQILSPFSQDSGAVSIILGVAPGSSVFKGTGTLAIIHIKTKASFTSTSTISLTSQTQVAALDHTGNVAGALDSSTLALLSTSSPSSSSSPSPSPSVNPSPSASSSFNTSPSSTPSSPGTSSTPSPSQPSSRTEGGSVTPNNSPASVSNVNLPTYTGSNGGTGQSSYPQTTSTQTYPSGISPEVSQGNSQQLSQSPAPIQKSAIDRIRERVNPFAFLQGSQNESPSPSPSKAVFVYAPVSKVSDNSPLGRVQNLITNLDAKFLNGFSSLFRGFNR